MRNLPWLRSGVLALAALTGAAVVAPSAQAAKICPQFLIKSCVFDNKTHLIFSTFTNPCLASQRGWTVIYVGACKFGKA